MTTSTPSSLEAFEDAYEDVAEWSFAVSAWRTEDIEAVVDTWQIRECNAYGRDFLTNAKTVLSALSRVASAIEISILKTDAAIDTARLNTLFSPSELDTTDADFEPVFSQIHQEKIIEEYEITDKQYNAIKESHKESQIELTQQAVKELITASTEDLAEAVKAVKAGEAPSLLAWYKTRQAREEGSDLMAELEAANQPRNPNLISLGTLAQLQAVISQSDTIICQQRTFTALAQDTHNSGAVLDLDAITEPQIIKESSIT